MQNGYSLRLIFLPLNIGPDGTGVVPQESVRILEKVGSLIHGK